MVEVEEAAHAIGAEEGTDGRRPEKAYNGNIHQPAMGDGCSGGAASDRVTGHWVIE